MLSCSLLHIIYIILALGESIIYNETIEKMKRLNVPKGFEMEIYALGDNSILEPRCIKHILYKNHTIVYLSSNANQSVYALVDIESDGKSDFIVPVVNNIYLNATENRNIITKIEKIKNNFFNKIQKITTIRNKIKNNIKN
eukprot:238653_1